MLLREPASATSAFKKLLVPLDAFRFIEPELGAALAETLSRIKGNFQIVEGIQLGDYDWDQYVTCFRVLQSFSAWETHGEWIERVKPKFDQSIQERFDFARAVTLEEKTAAEATRTRIMQMFVKLLPPDTVLCLPTTWNLPPLVDATPNEFLHERLANLKLTVLSPLANLPQVTMPIKYDEVGHTSGLSFVAGQNGDLELLTLTETIAARVQQFELDKFPQQKGS